MVTSFVQASFRQPCCISAAVDVQTLPGVLNLPVFGRLQGGKASATSSELVHKWCRPEHGVLCLT